MTDQREKIKEAVCKAIDTINETLAEDQYVPKDEETVLLDQGEGVLDSLGLPMLIVAIEQEIKTAYDMRISLVGGTLFPEGVNPFKSIETLIDHIGLILEQKG